MFETWTEPSSPRYPDFHDTFGRYVFSSLSDTEILNIPTIGLIGTDNSADKIRKELYALAYPFSNCKVLDLGNLTKKGTDELGVLLQEVIKKGIIPILISSDKGIMLEQVQTGTQLAPASSWVVIHPTLGHDIHLLSKIEPLCLSGSIKIRFLGHQTHITPASAIATLHDLDLESLRLGHVRQNLDRVEPWCRSVDHAIFDVNALRKTDFNAKADSNPGGFFYEEACKIAQYIGASSHLQSFGIYGYQTQLDHDGISAAVIAQLIWYTIDGLNNFREEKNIQKQKLTQYIVHASHNDMDINFWKSQDSGRWWMEVPGHEHHWISCTYDDYLEASHGDFSQRLINVLNRM